MSRFTAWFVAGQLRDMGWPKSKGLFRKQYLDTMVLDRAVERAIHVAVGLGAGRPELGLAALADTFANNPWTEQSTSELLRDLKEKGERAIQSSPRLAPWNALYAEHRLAPDPSELPPEALGDVTLASIWGMVSARGIYWGLTHQEDMPTVFENAKVDYEQTAAEAIPSGLAVPSEYPWNSLEHFYEHCSDLVTAFESVLRPLRNIPSALRTTPEVVNRLGTE